MPVTAHLEDLDYDRVWELVHSEAARRLGLDGYGLEHPEIRELRQDVLIDFTADINALRIEHGDHAVATLVALADTWEGSWGELVDATRHLYALERSSQAGSGT